MSATLQNSWKAWQLILSILQKELQMDTAQIWFHAVHRIGKQKENKHRPIIARFFCREDRDQVFARKKGIKESTRFKDAYITADYAKAIQDERRKLTKAMFKAKVSCIVIPIFLSKISAVIYNSCFLPVGF